MKKKAFTLVELLIVIAVIAILFIVLLSKVDFATDKAKDTGVMTDFRSYQIGVQQTIRENGMNDSWTTANFNDKLNSNLDKKLRFTLAGTEYRSNIENPYGFKYVIKKNAGEIQVFSIKQQGDVSVLNAAEMNVYAADPYSIGKVMILDVEDGKVESNIDKLADNVSVLAQAETTVTEPPEDPPVVHAKPTAIITMTPETNLKNNTNIVWSYASSTAEPGATVVDAQWTNSFTKYTPGTYTVGLIVTDSNGLQSDEVYKTFTVAMDDVWTQRVTGLSASDWVNWITYGNGVYVAVGSNGKILTSPDCITWTIRNNPFPTTGSIPHVCYGDGKFVAVAATNIATSADGVTWSMKTMPFEMNVGYLVYANNQFVLTSYNGEIATSPDGLTWTKQVSATVFSNYTIIYGGGQYVAAGYQGGLETSPDGKTWTLRDSKFGTTNIKGLAYGNGMYVAAGDGGKMASSPDGVNWTIITSPFGTTNIQRMGYGNGVFMAVGYEGKIATSTDGINWTLMPTAFGGSNVYGVSYINGFFVAGGAGGKIGTLGL